MASAAAHEAPQEVVTDSDVILSPREQSASRLLERCCLAMPLCSTIAGAGEHLRLLDPAREKRSFRSCNFRDRAGALEGTAWRLHQLQEDGP